MTSCEDVTLTPPGFVQGAMAVSNTSYYALKLSFDKVFFGESFEETTQMWRTFWYKIQNDKTSDFEDTFFRLRNDDPLGVWLDTMVGWTYSWTKKTISYYLEDVRGS